MFTLKNLARKGLTRINFVQRAYNHSCGLYCHHWYHYFICWWRPSHIFQLFTLIWSAKHSPNQGLESTHITPLSPEWCLYHRSVTPKFVTPTAPSYIDNIHDRAVGITNLGVLLLWSLPHIHDRYLKHFLWFKLFNIPKSIDGILQLRCPQTRTQINFCSITTIPFLYYFRCK